MMDSKKFNIFALIMVVVMCAFSIYIGVSNKAEDGVNGENGLSSYELAIKNGIISSDVSETQYLQSLYGQDGSSVTLEDVYEAYLSESGLTSEDLTYTEFILTYYPDKIVSNTDSISLVENTTQQALRSTVDICYSYYMETPIIYGYYYDDNNQNFIIDSSQSNMYVAVGVSAGSGVIYSYEDTDGDGEDDVAYIVTNYHVVYCDNYSNDDSYYVYYDERNQEYFTATYNESDLKTGRTTNGWVSTTFNYLEASSMSEAPIYTHFLEDYGIYLYGYQSAEYRISASFVGGSAENDIAVLKVEKDKENSNNSLIFSSNFKAADLGDSDNLNEGQSIVAVGNPLLANTSNIDSSSVSAYVTSTESAYISALCLTSTSGEISNLSENCEFTSILDSSNTTTMRLIRVSSAINAGNSGGGLYSTDGKLVGIVNGKIESSSYDNVGYAIPINIVKNIVEQVIEQCDDENSTTTRIQTLTNSSIGLEVKNGRSNSVYDSNSLTWELSYDVEVTSVSGLAQSAGIVVGDIIDSVEIDGVTYELKFYYQLNDLLLSVSNSTPKITFNIIRVESGNQNHLTIDINLTESSFVEIL